MIQEYLFTSDTNKADLKSMDVPEKVTKKITEIENSDCWILLISSVGDGKNVAKSLDSINRQICEKYKPTVLTNECSAYFNKTLYPIVNEFERKLRKVLYLASSLQKDENSKKNIGELETKDLGKIFEMLFTDAVFVRKVKETITKELTWQFTREELLKAISELDENKLWTNLLGDDCVETLCSSFSEVRNYRNDVMHAHNIGYEQFNKARKLFKKVNEELDSAIEKLIGAKKENVEVTSADFNSTLSSALNAMQSQWDTSSLSDAAKVWKTLTENQPIISPEVAESLSQFGQYALDEYTLKSEMKAAITNFSKFAALQSDIAPATKALSELAKQFAAYKIDIPPVVTKLQERLSEINFGTLPDSSDEKQDDEEEGSNE